MSTDSPHGRLIGAALLAAGFIVYGSLYPFQFHAASLSEAVRTLLLTDQMHDQPLSGLIANIAFYVPLGLLCVAAQPDRRSRWLQVLLATAAGTLLCLAMEIMQFFDVGRVTTLTDVYPNIAGTLIGALIALPLARYFAHSVDLSGPTRKVAVLLLLLFLVYRLFPYAPSLDIHVWWHAVKPVVRHPTLDVFDSARYLSLWCVVAVLLADLAGRRTSRWLLVLAILGVLSAKMIIRHNHLSASELIAVPFALIVWQGLAEASRRTVCALVALLVATIVVAQRLLPFDWQTFSHGFGWIPFFSVLHGSMAVNTQALAEKLFLYASLIWLLRGAGLRYPAAGALVALGLFVASLLETHLPGRSAEITDAVIAIMATLVLALLAPMPESARRKRRPGRRGGFRYTE